MICGASEANLSRPNRLFQLSGGGSVEAARQISAQVREAMEAGRPDRPDHREDNSLRFERQEIEVRHVLPRGCDGPSVVSVEQPVKLDLTVARLERTSQIERAVVADPDCRLSVHADDRAARVPLPSDDVGAEGRLGEGRVSCGWDETEEEG